jgi:6-phosphofructokinase 1
VSEGARVEGYSDEDIVNIVGRKNRTGRIGEVLAELIEEKTGYEARVSVLGHIQRGGTPTAYDRIIGTRFGFKAIELVKEGKFGKMVSLQNNKFGSVDIKDAVKKRKSIDPDLLEIAKVFFA